MNPTSRQDQSSFARFTAAAVAHARLGGLLLLALSGDRRARWGASGGRTAAWLSCSSLDFTFFP